MDPEPTHGLWASLHRGDLSPSEAAFSVIGIPYEGGASARKGARLGPQRIRFWTQHTTPFAEDPTRLEGVRICDLDDIEVLDQAREVITLLKSLHGLPLVGLDVVEVSPPLDPSEATVFAAVKFIMEFVAIGARQVNRGEP